MPWSNSLKKGNILLFVIQFSKFPDNQFGTMINIINLTIKLKFSYQLKLEDWDFHRGEIGNIRSYAALNIPANDFLCKSTYYRNTKGENVFSLFSRLVKLLVLYVCVGGADQRQDEGFSVVAMADLVTSGTWATLFSFICEHCFVFLEKSDQWHLIQLSQWQSPVLL